MSALKTKKIQWSAAVIGEKCKVKTIKKTRFVQGEHMLLSVYDYKYILKKEKGVIVSFDHNYVWVLYSHEVLHFVIKTRKGNIKII